MSQGDEANALFLRMSDAAFCERARQRDLAGRNEASALRHARGERGKAWHGVVAAKDAKPADKPAGPARLRLCGGFRPCRCFFYERHGGRLTSPQEAGIIVACTLPRRGSLPYARRNKPKVTARLMTGATKKRSSLP